MIVLKTIITDYIVDSTILVERQRIGSKAFILQEGHDGEMWIHAASGYESIPVNTEHRDFYMSFGWVACLGTKPVKVDGKWGGRNYPQILIPFNEMRRAFAYCDAGGAPEQ